MSQASATHEHPSYVQHHFVDADQQFESSKLGMWIFLVTEILFFGGLFAAYIIYRAWNPELYVLAAQQLDTTLGATNTLVLIASSLSMALGIYFMQKNNPTMSIRMMALTVVLALTFMVIKYFEYEHKMHLGIFPGEYYTYTGIDHPKAHIFFSIYYMMTGLHGVHVLIGVGLIIWLIMRARRGEFSSDYYTPIEITGLYWHLVDIVWIFLFPLLYLID